MKKHHILILYFLLLLPPFLTAQDSISFHKNLEEVTVSATRTAMTYRQVAQSIFSIQSDKIINMSPQTVPEILQKSGLVTVQKSQQGGGSPILRGMEANRVLLVVDGVRMNNLIYRGGHLQNAITVDPNMLDRMEVLFGPASSVYGSDALGGVVHLITKSPSFGDMKKLFSHISSRYSTVNNEKMLHYDLELRSNKIAAILSATVSDYGDLNGGRNKNMFYASKYGDRLGYYRIENGKDVLINNAATPWIQTPSGYSQVDLMGKVKLKSKNLEHLINLQYSNSTDIPRYDRLTDPNRDFQYNSAEWYYGPQKRMLASYETALTGSFPLKLNINYQSVEESRHDRKINTPTLRNRTEQIDVLGFDLFHNKSQGVNQWMIGIDGQYETAHSTAYKSNIISAERGALDTRYPSGYNRMMRIGGYSIFTQNLEPKFNLQESVRVGYTGLSSDFGTNEFFKFPFQNIRQNNFVYSGNIGLNYLDTKFSRWGLVIATGFRVPNVDDLSKVFESAPGTLVVPNPDLKPEKSTTFELNYKLNYSDEKSSFSSSIYLTQLTDVIVTRPFKFNGSDLVDYQGVSSKVLANQNLSSARIFGLTMHGQAYFANDLSLVYGGNYTVGRILHQGTRTPLDHIPPISGSLSVVYDKKQTRLEFNLLGNAWKRINDYLLNGEDNEQYATPDGMPAWLVFNIMSSFQVMPNVKLGLGLENIFDTQYRVFSSGINAPGRNLTISVRANF
ncbi:MAG: TonB-dependent receptor [Saprospiraceae bacterium]|nr:TonB-dependent receptor [Saprospiraceae bacterium]